MANDDKFITIIESLSDIRERLVRMEVEQTHSKQDLEELKTQDHIQNQLLAEHIRGVNTANARLDNEILIRKSLELKQTELENKIEKLEEPNKFLATLKKYLLYIAAVGGAATAIHNWFKS
jgi:septal ring factor EnvC (AmiA/AmiB activator)